MRTSTVNDGFSPGEMRDLASRLLAAPLDDLLPEARTIARSGHGNLVSHSRGREPYRRVRLYPDNGAARIRR